MYCQTIRSVRDIYRDDRARIATCILRTLTYRNRENYSIDDFCPLPGPDVGLSIFVCDVEHTSFYFGLCGRRFVLCLFGQCPCLCTICHSWHHTGVVHLSLQADGKVAFSLSCPNMCLSRISRNTLYKRIGYVIIPQPRFSSREDKLSLSQFRIAMFLQ